MPPLPTTTAAPHSHILASKSASSEGVYDTPYIVGGKAELDGYQHPFGDASISDAISQSATKTSAHYVDAFSSPHGHYVDPSSSLPSSGKVGYVDALENSRVDSGYGWEVTYTPAEVESGGKLC